MKLILLLVAAFLIAVSQATVDQTLSSLDRSLSRRLADMKATLEANVAARKKALVIPFENLQKAREILKKVLAEVATNGAADLKKYTEELNGLKAQRDTIQTMKNLNAKLDNHKKHQSAIYVQLSAMLAALNMQIKADEAAFADREKKREARKTLVKTNEGKAKKAYNDLVAANAKANKTEQDNFNAEEKKINAEKSSVALAKRALFEAFEKKPERVVQYVRINNPSSYLQLAEVEVYNQAGVNVALHQSTRQSSTGWGGVSSRAVDGNTDGHWSKQTTTHTQKGGWWEVNLGQPRAVSEVKVYNRKDCCAARLKGSTLEFLDKNRKPVLKKFTLSGTTNVQVFKVKGKCTC